MVGITKWQDSAAKLARFATSLRRATLELVFPGTCAGCSADLTSGGPAANGVPFCRACFDELDLFGAPTCRRCGGPVPVLGAAGDGEPPGLSRRDKSAGSHGESKAQGGCFRCRGHKLWFDEAIAAGLYAGRLRELVLRMKRSEGDPLSLALGQLVWGHCGERLAALEADVVVPIPLHWRRRLAHRTNSAAVLAEVLAGRLRVPLADGLLRRRRHTVRQAELTPPQRWENVRRAFSVTAAYHLRRAHVLVVDDILTTGATCSEAARTLRDAGAERVSVVVAARAIG